MQLCRSCVECRGLFLAGCMGKSRMIDVLDTVKSLRFVEKPTLQYFGPCSC